MRDARFALDDEVSVGRALEQVAAGVRPPAPAVDIASAVRARIEQDQLAATRRRGHHAKRVLAAVASVALLAVGGATVVGRGLRSGSGGGSGSVEAGAPAPGSHAPSSPSPSHPSPAAGAPASGTAAANGTAAGAAANGSDNAGANAGGPVHTSLGAIRDRLGFTLMVPAELGVPDAVIDQSRPGEPRVVLVYRPTDGTPGSAVQVVETAGADDYRNVADAALVRHDGFTGFWYQAPGVGTVEADGNGWLSGHPIQRWNTLLWQSSGVTMRIDSQLPLAAAISVASSMTPAELERSLRNLS